LGVYGVDTGLTLLERLWRGENIFQSHRRHLFQYLVFNLHWPHLRVAWLYGGAQALLNVALVAGIESGFVGLPEAGLLLGFLVMVFWFIRIEVKRAIA
jgi:UDP-GlcNAc:undecaprenyl-phosphate GlcNAc-1-phosphate transferase